MRRSDFFRVALDVPPIAYLWRRVGKAKRAVLPPPTESTHDRGLPACQPQQYLAIAKLERFAALRRQIGYRYASRVMGVMRERILGALTGCDVGRIGEETIDFVFCAASREDAAAQLLGVCSVLEEQIEIDGLTFDLDVLIGTVVAPDASIENELVERARAALLEASRLRQRVVVGENNLLAGSETENVTLMRDFLQAVAADELELHYQPKLRARTLTVDSAEALLRWPQRDGEAVDTELLIKIAEETGAIRHLTDWAIDQAIEDQRRLQLSGHDVTIYVNISGLLVSDDGFARGASARIAAAGARIGFEITETAVIADPDGALTNLRHWADAGIRIAIDDYGSGLSSLAYLKQLPAHELKIDKMFIMGLTSSHRDPLLVRSSIDLAHALEMDVTAEGVEDAMSLSLLRVMGCDLIQGYVVSRPLPLAEFERFLKDGDEIRRLEQVSGGMASFSDVVPAAGIK